MLITSRNRSLILIPYLTSTRRSTSVRGHIRLCDRQLHHCALLHSRRLANVLLLEVVHRVPVLVALSLSTFSSKPFGQLCQLPKRLREFA